MPKELSPTEILALPMQSNDADAATIRDYLVKLLTLVWAHGEGFNGKRPFGNSSWDCELYEALGRGGAINVVFDGDGFLEDWDDVLGDKLIADAIRALGTPV
jgi:hypothetical protein